MSFIDQCDFKRKSAVSCAVAMALGVAVVPGLAMAQAQTGTGAASSAQAGLEEVVVTAQRREERRVDVPLSVTALSGDTLETMGISDTTALTQVTPGLRMDRLGVYTQPAIRGVTAASTSPGAEANVSLYIDGIYQPNQAANNVDLPDIATVEILKGPQGTLFGRNATGGAIRVFTREPEYTTTGNFSVGYGSYNDVMVKGFFTMPLVDDKLAVSISGLWQENDGWTKDLLNNGKEIGPVESQLVRGKLLWQPSDGIKVLLSGQYSERKDESLFLYSAVNGNTSGRNPDVSPGPLGPVATQPYTTAVNFPSNLDVRNWNVGLTAEFDLGSVGTLTSFSAYSKVHIVVSADGDASAAEITSFTIQSPDENFAQELNFASEKFGDFSFVAGLYYYRDDSGYDPLIGNFSGFAFDNYSDVTVRATAAYFEGSYEFTPDLVGIAGVRYSKEERTVQYTGGLAAVFVGTDRHEETWDATTPKLSLRYAIAPSTNIYATYSEGFKSGVYDLNSTATTPVEPEEIKAYEVGIKTDQDNYDLSAAAFFYDYTNLQVQYNNGNFDALQNAGSAEIYGLELEGHFLATEELTLTGGLSLLHARYKDYDPASILVPITDSAGNPVGGNAIVPDADLSDGQMTRAPDWTVNVGADYEHPMSAGTLRASLNVFLSDTAPLEQSARITQDAYTQANALVSFQPADSKFRYSVWVKNLTDEEIIQSSFITTATDGVSFAPPRTFGATVDFAF